MSMDAKTERGMGRRALEGVGQGCGCVAGGAALVLLWVFALTGGTRGRTVLPNGRQAP